MKVIAVKYLLMAEDMQRAARFYCDVFGLQVAIQSPHWSELRFGDAVVALHGGGDGELNRTGLSIQVDDLDDACRQVQQAGGKVLSGPADRPGEPIRLADVVDTEGNQFAITEYVGG